MQSLIYSLLDVSAAHAASDKRGLDIVAQLLCNLERGVILKQRQLQALGDLVYVLLVQFLLRDPLDNPADQAGPLALCPALMSSLLLGCLKNRLSGSKWLGGKDLEIRLLSQPPEYREFFLLFFSVLPSSRLHRSWCTTRFRLARTTGRFLSGRSQDYRRRG